MAFRAAGTVMEAAGDVTVPELALMVTTPRLLPRTVARPELLMLTAVGTEDTQVTDELMLAVVLLL